MALTFLNILTLTMTKLNLIMRKNLTRIRLRDGLGFDPPEVSSSVWSLIYKAQYLSVAMMTVLVLGATLVTTQYAQAQNNCSCTDFRPPLDSMGGKIITPAMVLSNDGTTECDDTGFYVELTDSDGNPLTDAEGNLLPQRDSLRCNHVGEDIKAEVYDTNGDIVCWAYARPDDKIGPTCFIEDIEISCEDFRDPAIIRVDTIPFDSGSIGEPGSEYSDLSSLQQYGRILGVSVYVDISFQDLDGLAVALVPPGSDPIYLIQEPTAACSGVDDLNVTFNQSGKAFDCNDLTGVIQPEVDDLSTLVGTSKGGQWRLAASDNNGTPVNGRVNDAYVIVTYDYRPLVEDNCDEIPQFSFEDEEFFPNCPDRGTILRTWTVTDPGGLTCTATQTVTVVLNEQPTIIWPRDTSVSCVVDIDDLDPVDLEQYDRPSEGIYYSRPFFDGADDYCGNLARTYTDEIYDICLPYGYKIRREWKVRDWCDPEFEEEYVQYIKVLDEEAPEIFAPDTVRYTVEHNDCELDVDLPEVRLEDNCDTDPTSTVELVEHATGLRLPNTNVPPGSYDAIYTATDLCGNNSRDTVVVIIEDLIEPVPICDRNTNITLTNRGGSDEGWADICFSTIDDGSYDNCTNDDELIVLISKSGSDGTFQECLTYRCDEVGENEIFLRVWDASGNYNTCWANLFVEDKVAPELTAEADTIFCTDDIDNELEEIVQITEEEWESKGLITDNCDSTRLICTDFAFEGDDCNPVWSRTCFVEDQYGNQSLSQEHRVFVLDTTPWEVVSFPEDQFGLECGSPTDPSRTGEPVVDYDCEHIGIRFEDEEFQLCGNSPTIVKIRRTWYVTDWCTGEDITHVQEIYQEDDVPPMLMAPGDFTAEITGNSCEVVTPVEVTATDDCNLPVEITNSRDGQVIVGTGRFVFILTPGVYPIEVRAEDACGNVTIEELTITVVDAKAPTARCSDITVNIKPTEIAVVKANSLNNDSDDNCTDPENLEFMVQRVDSRGDSLGARSSEVQFDCDDVDSIQMVRLYVTDASGNTASCMTTVDVQDVDSICGGGSSRFVSVAGSILTDAGDPIDNATVLTDIPGTPSIKTNADGQFMFPALEKGYNYMMTVEKNDDYKEGISTIDLVYIKRHILRIDRFDSPYEWIAADANASESVTTFDIAQLRRLILRLDDALADSDSWKFIDKSHVFDIADNPWSEPIPEYIMSENLQEDKVSLEFVGVKVGDVDQSYFLDAGQARDFAGDYVLQAQDKTFEAGTEVQAVLNATAQSVLGAQFTLSYDPSVLTYTGISSGVITEEHLGLNRLDEGIITVSWDNYAGEELNEALMAINFATLSSSSLSAELSVGSEFTPAEAYDLAGNRMNVQLQFTEALSAQLELFQNKPNPFNDRTVIGFTIPTDDNVQLTISDMSGRVMYTTNGQFRKGYNEFTVSSRWLNNSGVYYYQVETSSAVATKKMVLIQN